MGYFVFKYKKKWGTQKRIPQFPQKKQKHFLNNKNAKSMLCGDETRTHQYSFTAFTNGPTHWLFLKKE